MVGDEATADIPVGRGERPGSATFGGSDGTRIVGIAGCHLPLSGPSPIFEPHGSIFS